MIVTQEMLKKRPVSSSSIKEFRKSPKHYIQYITKEWKPPTDAMRLGNTIECLLLEPKKFEKKFMLYEKPNLRSKDGKAEMEGIIANANGRELITQDIIDVAKLCVESVMSYDVSKQLIEARKAVQVKLQWQDKSGIPCIGYEDFYSQLWESEFIVDLKTSNRADPDDIARGITNFDFHIQAGAYLEGHPRRFYTFPGFIFLYVETVEPYNVSVNVCEPDFIEQAKEEWRASVQAFKYCMDNDLWHQGYEFRLQARDYFGLRIPKWYKPKFM